MKPVLLSFIFLSQAHAAAFDPTDLTQAYLYLNQLRIRAGMTEFSPNGQLELAAFNHANYLADNFLDGHFEKEELQGFTGKNPSERAIFAGYRSLIISENVSSGDQESIESIDGLMSAIYHRLGFLDFVNNEVGIGIAQVSEPQFHSVYVYNMGNSIYNTLCQGPGFSGAGSFYRGVCEPNISIEATQFDNVEQTAMGQNPNIVIWPADGDQTVPPVFFEESPDPLPDYSVSGYPISIQFNPLAFSEVNLSTFKLFRELDNSEILSTRLLTQSTDPNGRLSPLEYVLFPLERLDWDTAYWVQAQYATSTGNHVLTWRFKTRNLGIPLLTVEKNSEEFLVPTSSTFAVYVPPNSSLPEIGSIRYQFSVGLDINIAFEDANTLKINLSGQVGQEVIISFSGGRQFTLKISENVSWLENQPLSELNLPNLGSSLTANSLFQGGVSVNEGRYQKQATQNLSDRANIVGLITVDPSHIGQTVDILVCAKYSQPPFPDVVYFVVEEGGRISIWDQNFDNLMAFSKAVKLDEKQIVPLYQGFLVEGLLEIFFGYRLSNGTIIRNEDSIDITVQSL